MDDDDNDFDIHLQGINNINDHQRTATLTAPTLNHTPATSLTTSSADQQLIYIYIYIYVRYIIFIFYI